MTKRTLLYTSFLIACLSLLALFQASRMQARAAALQPDGPSAPAQTDLSLLYFFSGVTDDGKQGASDRAEATSIHCTNVSTDTTRVEVQVYQWNGSDVYTGTVSMPPNRTFTFSTQNTTIYFDDVLLGSSPGTDAVFQGSGRILTDRPYVVCTAQVLDPLGYPPVFAEKLTMFDRNGNLVKHQLPRPDLSLAMEASPASALPGQPVQFTLTYRNSGANIANQAIITDSLPPDLVNLSISSSTVVTPVLGDPFTILLGDVFPDESGTITMNGQVSPSLTADTTLDNFGQITGTPADSGPAANTAQASITVNLPRVSFSQGSYPVDEAANSINLSVSLSPPNPYSQTTVKYQTVDGSAAAGEDYTAVSGELTFLPGEDTQSISIPILKNTPPEGYEYFMVDISLPVGAVIGSIPTAQITIEDDWGIYLPVVIR